MVFIYFLAKSAMLFNGAERFVQFSCEIVSKNLYNNLAKEVVESFFSIIALVAMFFFFFFFFLLLLFFFSTERNGLSNFGGRSPKKHSVILFQNPSIGLAGEVVVIFFFSFYSFGCHLVQQSKFWSVLVGGHLRNIFIIISKFIH